ncbi:tetratricopeptide repeat protein [Pontibacter sp. G13]|uniref:tetratricopeptide repeat protein n=1 Tax=Pontibacter sp. G13 TaxID=3074898 RepID=UPI00288B367E|nr:tetratricopeptide repeat protein [Pontibacter sp. G13]WNJ16461.1 tetratricopeptide repeat protein [Pontibacter sp. G13]
MRNLTLTWLLMVCCWTWVQGQDVHELDSISHKFSSLQSKEETLNFLLEHGSNFVWDDLDSGRVYMNRCLEYALEDQNLLAKGMAYSGIGDLYRRMGKTERAWYSFDRAEESFKSAGSPPDEISLLYTRRGAVAFQIADHETSNHWYSKALAVADSAGLELAAGRALHNMAALYGTLGRNKEALQCYIRSKDVFAKYDDSRSEAICRGNISLIYLEEGDHQKALDELIKLIPLQRTLGDLIGITATYSNMGDAYKALNDPDNALHYYRLALQLRLKNNQRFEIISNYNDISEVFLSLSPLDLANLDSAKRYASLAEVYNNDGTNVMQSARTSQLLGEMFMKQDNVNRALPYLVSSLEEFKKSGQVNNQVTLCGLLASAYSQVGNYQEAFKCMEHQRLLRDSLISMGAETHSSAIFSEYDLQKQVAELRDAEEKRQMARWTNYALVCLVVILLLIGGMGYTSLRYREQSRISRLLARKNEEIQEQNRKLELYNADLEQFAFAVSHNLKEPLRRIGSYTGLIERKYGSLFDLDGKAYLNYALTGVEQMNDLLKDLLIYVQIGKGTLNLETIHLESTLNHVKKAFQHEIRNFHVDIRTIPASLPAIEGNRRAIELLMTHLMSNAIKFRKPDIPPQVVISYQQEEGKHILAFRDNGIGMDPQYHRKVFGIFQRLHTSQEYPGTGIGLAICHKVVHLHNGEIRISSELDKGTTFWIELPVVDLTKEELTDDQLV